MTRRNKALISFGLLEPDEVNRVQTEAGEYIRINACSIMWSDYRKRWIMIACEMNTTMDIQWDERRQNWITDAVEKDGTSKLGEIWYAESPDPAGPWKHAKKIVTHGNYSFYNPHIHPFFTQDGGKSIFFEGTYTRFLTDNVPAPGYDYNQIMYKLRLDHPRLGLPPVEQS